MQYCYQCQKCAHEQEIQHKLADTNKESCEKCAAPPEEMKRIMSLTAGRHGSWGRWKANDAVR